MNVLGRHILSAPDIRAALILRKEWRSDPFSDWQAAARLLMSPPKVRDLMQRLVIANLAGCRIDLVDAGWVSHVYRLRVDPAASPSRFDTALAEAYDASIWAQLERVHAKITDLKGKI